MSFGCNYYNSKYRKHAEEKDVIVALSIDCRSSSQVAYGPDSLCREDKEACIARVTKLRSAGRKVKNKLVQSSVRRVHSDKVPFDS